ncbi:hypothetical protein AAV94_12665 [Lampropedia cohaerens]|uniref:Head-tail adaptor protein n=1 Tax=Lampropedia cohaerens TaxID=1610491 RepID=A0A0U1PX59_9BURK|nr:phage head closure protein [Lampropedia cohaerens]KKW66925.1 hypothetical protein AAV94_12665 [Lampropedia cohaerens]
MLEAGRLDQRVTIRKLTTGRNPNTGGIIETWSDVATVWAAVEPLNGREFFAASAQQSEVTTRIRMRYRPDITPQMKINHNGSEYDIQAVINPKSKGAELVLMCRALV